MPHLEEDLVFLESGTAPLTTLSALLSELGVSDAHPMSQRRAVERWLSDNDPVPLLRFILERAGYVVSRKSA